MTKTLPPNNPFLTQDSVYPTVHFDPAQTDAPSLPVWKGETSIESSQLDWLQRLGRLLVRPFATARAGVTS
jgi:hypothetical protein